MKHILGTVAGAAMALAASLALLVVIIGIMMYLAVRFEWKFAVAAIIANSRPAVV